MLVPEWIRTVVIWTEKIVITMLAVSLFLRLMPQFSFHPLILLYLANELASCLLILLQRKGAVAMSPYAIAIGFLGTMSPLLISAEGAMIAPQWLSDGLFLCGASLSLLAKLTLRRSFGLIAANRGVRLGGPYRIVRHPMYSGYMIGHIGYILGHLSAWNLAVFAATWALLWLRTGEEEKMLETDEAYRQYKLRVRARLVPALL